MAAHRLPPHLIPADRLVLFDGICKLCNAWARLIIRQDDRRLFTLGSMQSSTGQRILGALDMSTTHFNTVLYIEHGRAFEKSDAVLHIVARLGWPWRLLAVFRLVPRPVRDWVYDRVAAHRYRIFGRYTACTLPSTDHDDRFIDEA